MDKYLDAARRAALEAGNFLLDSFNKTKDIRYKDREHKNPTSEVDEDAESIILDILSRHFPDHSFLTEERGEVGKPADYRWFIDPLDGTVNYIHGHRYFCVSIALSYREDGIVGVIYNPVANEVFSAVKGGGAYLNEKRIHVSETARLKESLVGMAFPYGRDSAAFHTSASYFTRLSRDSQAVRRDGSTALSLCNVACGRYDSFFVIGNELWDYAAGTLLVTEAGGKVTNFKGEPIRLSGRGYFLATNGRIHDSMLKRFGEEGSYKSD